MKERPIIFSGPVVCAILDGTKSQTRRVIKPQPTCIIGVQDWKVHCGETFMWHGWPHYYKGDSGPIADKHGMPIKRNCPYGVPGDRLWVRETWATDRRYNNYKPSDLPNVNSLWWKADKSSHRFLNAKPGRWRPSIHMPKDIARIWLEVVSVRAERLQDISERDAYAEGFPLEPTAPHPIAWFRDLWDSLTAKRGLGWAENPWAWTVEFRKIDNDN